MGAKKSSSDVGVGSIYGVGAKQRLTSALRDQYIVHGKAALAEKIYKKATFKRYSASKTLIEQGNEDTHLVLILSGSVQVLVNNRIVATRKAGEHVGEMALIERFAKRSATIKATEPTIVAEVPEHEFTALADKFPSLWQRLALSLSERLRERSKFHAYPRNKPVVFIASSMEGHRYAKCISEALTGDEVIPRLWTSGVFEPGKTTIEDLVKMAGEVDFAVIITSKDDVTISKKIEKPSPRDNVIFELGLFMGALSRERTLMLVPKGAVFKVPTDLSGMTYVPYKFTKNGKVKPALKDALKVIRKKIKDYGPK